MNREVQLELLQELKGAYPNRVRLKDTNGAYAINSLYLHEHGLVECHSRDLQDGIHVHSVKITAKGLDFLADDGGLTAILGVVRVQLHEDSIKALIAARVDESDLPEPEKSAIKKHLQSLPGSALAHLTNKLLDLGLSSGPGALDAIQKWIGPG